MKNKIGIRMKEFYENRTKTFLPRRTYTIIRVDGKAFHTYTKGLERPFDDKLINDMDETAKYMCKNIQGAVFAFVQSDEISILLTDFKSIKTSAWFDGNVQKMTSISSSLATAKFNELRPGKLALFDSRVFTIPHNVEVENYFIDRQIDTIRNSISSLAQSLFSSKELHKVNTTKMIEMCLDKGDDWNSYDGKKKYGRLIVKESYDKDGTTRSKWVSKEPPVFTEDREVLINLIPKYE